MLERARSTSGLYTLSVEKVNGLEVPLPQMATQRSIAADLIHRLTEADRLTAIIRDELAAIEAMPTARLREAFNGNDQPQGQ